MKGLGLEGRRLVGGKTLEVHEEELMQPETAEAAWIRLTVWNEESAIEFLTEHCGFQEGGVEDAVKGFIRPGIEVRPDYTLFVLPVLEPLDGQASYIPVGFIVGRGRLVTIAPHQPASLDTLFRQWQDDPDDFGRDNCHLLYTILDNLVDDFFPRLDQIHDRIEGLEDTIFLSQKLDPTEALSLKRELLEMRRQISPIRDTINALIRHGAPLVPVELSADFSDAYNHTMRLTESIDLGRDILSTIMDVHLGLVSNRLNEIMRTLTVISTMLMASALIAGIYGMNFQHMPELSWQYGYPLALGLMLLSCGGIYWIFRRKGWV